MATDKWYYAIYNPYGAHTVNSDGNQPNQLYQWSPKAVRDDWVDTDGYHRRAVPASDKYVKRLKAQGDEHGWPVNFLEDKPA